VKQRDHLFEVRSAAVIDDSDAAEVQTVIARVRADGFLIAQQCNTRDALTHAMRRGRDCTRVVSFGKYDVLGSGSGTLANSVENVHV
jgi:hypothetical protein